MAEIVGTQLHHSLQKPQSATRSMSLGQNRTSLGTESTFVLASFNDARSAASIVKNDGMISK